MQWKRNKQCDGTTMTMQYNNIQQLSKNTQKMQKDNNTMQQEKILIKIIEN
jgi:hypothetical protein